MSDYLRDRDAFSEYWLRLDELNAQEWESFYRLVRQALVRCPAPELGSLPDTRESYIDEFFTEKLFFKAQRMSDTGIQSLSGGALCRFFRNYLLDHLRHYERRPIAKTNPDDEGHSEVPDDDGQVDRFVSTIGRDRLGHALQAFLASLPDWALLMLRGHFCADEDEAAPMSSLCKGIPSYHYKAQKLGITVKRGADGLIGYEHTQIGQWMESIGVQIAPENHAVMTFLLGAICLEAAAIVEVGA